MAGEGRRGGLEPKGEEGTAHKCIYEYIAAISGLSLASPDLALNSFVSA